jgi:uncharacterized protein YukE
MTLTHGADTAALRHCATQLDALARRSDEACTDMSRAASRLRSRWQGPDSEQFSSQAKVSARDVQAVTEAVRAMASTLRAQADEQDATSREGGAPGGPGPGPAPSGPVAPAVLPSPAEPPRPVSELTPPPQASTSPADNATWWASLSPAEQAAVLAAHPEWLGNRDGIPFDVRDQANRAYLPTLRADLEAQRAALTQGTDDRVADWLRVGDQYRWLQERWDGAETWVSGDPLIRSELDDKIASLDAVERAIAQPDRQLIELDASRDRMEAAVAVGDVQTADHVAVFTPGLTSTVQGSLEGYDRDMYELRNKASADLVRAERGGEQVATVAWIGYQAPQLDGSVLLGGDRSVASNAMAREGGVQLAAFNDGIVAARSDDPHLTNLGHSYGSTTTSSGLQRTDVVDDAVLFGSPGPDSGWRDWLSGRTPDHGLDQGNIYVLENDGDVVADLDYFGRDPSWDSDSYTHLSTQDSQHGSRTTGHSSYLDARSTSQHNISQVVIGGDERVGR